MLPRARLLLPLTLAAAFSASAATIDDGPPVDAAGILSSLQKFKETQTAQSAALRQRGIQDALAAAGSPARAMELWEDAYRSTQLQGSSKEGAQFRAWKDGEGSVLKEKEVLTALRLHFSWLALTLQRSGGALAKDLLPAIINHAHEAIADRAMMDAFDDDIKREKEKEALTPQSAGNQRRNINARDREKRVNGELIKRVHDQIALRPLSNSIYVEWLHLGDAISEFAPPARRGQGQGQAQGRGPGKSQAQTAQAAAAPAAAPATAWESTPANFDGIYMSIILPELRLLKDPRVLEYWDAKLRREADVATRGKLTFEVEKFNQVRRPQLQWSRAQEFAAIGMKNRAATEMFTLVKTYPTHPDAPGWITELEGLLAPPGAAPATASTAAAPSP